MLNTSDVKSLSKGGTTVSLEEISNNIDNKLSIDSLKGGNGIVIDKAAMGETVEVKVAAPLSLTATSLESVPIIITNSATPRPAISITITNHFGPPTSSGIVLDDDNNYVRVGGRAIAVGNNSSSKQIRITDTDVVYVDDATNNNYYFLRQGNVKTINGISLYETGDIAFKTVNGSSVVGGGNIDTTPTLKTINSQSLTGDGNINTLKVYHGNEWNPEVASDFSGDMWLGYRTLTSGQDPTGAGTTSVAINAFKFANGNGSGGFSDVYCKKLYTSSDERLKENIKPYEPTASVLDLSVKEFNYKDSKVKSVGVIAQEVQKLFPDAVSADEKTGYFSVDDRSLMYMLIAEVKKLRDRIDELEGK